jgi:UTP--glucose-1-phosphate uridylyltransferase
MLPVFARDSKGLVLLKPVIQLVFERLYDSGLREFLFVVGKGKRSIEDHFTPDNGFTEHLRRLAKPRLVNEMELFYQRVRSSSIVFINQPEPLGFGDAVLRAKPFTGQKPFIVHAGDDLIISRDAAYFRRLMRAFTVHEADAAFCVQKVKDPTKYGVIEGDRIGLGIYRVRHVVEKPRRPKSRVAVVALYAFNERIYHFIERVRKCHDRELELTDAIEGLVKDGGKVYAVELNSNETRIDIGTPESYWNALRATIK